MEVEEEELFALVEAEPVEEASVADVAGDAFATEDAPAPDAAKDTPVPALVVCPDDPAAVCDSLDDFPLPEVAVEAVIVRLFLGAARVAAISSSYGTHQIQTL